MEEGFFENFKAISTDMDNINFQRFATVIDYNGDTYTVREDGDNDVKHSNVLLPSNLSCEVGDKVVIGFIDNSIYSPVIIGNLTRGIIDKEYFFTLNSFFDPNQWTGSPIIRNNTIILDKDSSFPLRVPPNCVLMFNMYLSLEGYKIGDVFDFSILGNFTTYVIGEGDIEQGVDFPISITCTDNNGVILSEGTGDEWIISNISSLEGLLIPVKYGSTVTISNVQFSNNNDIDEELSTTSINPVQNKVITNALNGKSNINHNHITSDIIEDYELDNIGTSSGANQSEINQAIDAMIERDGDYFFTLDSFFDPNQWTGEPIINNGIIGLDEDASFPLRLPPNCRLAFELYLGTLTYDVGDTFTFKIFGYNISYTLTQHDVSQGVAIDVNLNCLNNTCLFNSDKSGDTFSINNITSYEGLFIQVNGFTVIRNVLFENNSVTVDDVLSTISTNPVQNAVITYWLERKSNINHNHTTSDITNFPSLATVATSGSYDDLTDKPSIPSKTSDLTNDGDGTNVFVKDNDTRLSDARTPLSHNHDDRYYTETETDALLDDKQDSLVSGTNIKTINNESLLGSGNITIQGGGSVTIDDQLDNISTNPVENRVITNALDGKSDTNHNHDYNDLTNKPDVINYQLTSNYYNPDINGTFTLTLKVTDIYGDPISNHNAGTLKENGYNVYDTSGNQIGASMVTDANGECSVTIPCYNLYSELYLQNNNSEAMLWSLRDYSVGDAHCQVQAEGWYYYNNTSTYKLSRNGYLARFSLHGWSTGTVLTTTSWTNFGGSTAYAANIVPSSYVIMLNSGCNTYFRINTNGTIVCRAVSSNVAGGTNQYGTVTWSCDK